MVELGAVGILVVIILFLVQFKQIQALYFVVLPLIIINPRMIFECCIRKQPEDVLAWGNGDVLPLPLEYLSSIFLFPCCVGLVWYHDDDQDKSDQLSMYQTQADLHWQNKPDDVEEFRPLEMVFIYASGFLRLLAYLGGFKSLGHLVTLLKQPMQHLGAVLVLSTILSLGFSLVFSVVEHSSDTVAFQQKNNLDPDAFEGPPKRPDAFEGIKCSRRVTQNNISHNLGKYLWSSTLAFMSQMDHSPMNHSHQLVMGLCFLLKFVVQFIVPMILVQFIQQKVKEHDSNALWQLDRATLIESIDSELSMDDFDEPRCYWEAASQDGVDQPRKHRVLDGEFTDPFPIVSS